MSFSDDHAVDMQLSCKHQDTTSIPLRRHIRDDEADERPAGATAKSLA